MKRLILALSVVAGSIQPAASQTADEVGKIAEAIIEHAQCRVMVLHWNAGLRDDLVRSYGDYAASIVRSCRIANQARDSDIARFLEQYPDALTPPE